MSKESSNFLSSFIDFVRKRGLPEAICQDIPYIGNTLQALIFGRSKSVSFDQILKDFDQNHEKIKPIIEKLIEDYSIEIDITVIIGSGVLENVLTIEEEFNLGEKHIVKRDELLGGSGVNYTLRLINAGHKVLPILSLGSNDIPGTRIHNEIRTLFEKNTDSLSLVQFVQSERFRCDKIKTPQSTILIFNGKRTILTDKMEGVEHFKEYVLSRLDAIDQLKNVRIKAVMIGHIYADSPDLNPNEPGEITLEVIRRYRNKALIFANFGSSQLKLGSKFWLVNRGLNNISIFQLSLSEAKMFFNNDVTVNTLLEMISWFRKNSITAVITLDKFGAVANFEDGSDGVILGWPYELEEVVDPTGAGDAFGSGLVATLNSLDKYDVHDFQRAINTARVWAAYACGFLGGAEGCPDKSSLNRFKKLMKDKEFDPVEIKKLDQANRIIRLLDKAFV